MVVIRSGHEITDYAGCRSPGQSGRSGRGSFAARSGSLAVIGEAPRPGARDRGRDRLRFSQGI
jgi:hypothetical protein